jgi:hypothetical protein
MAISSFPCFHKIIENLVNHKKYLASLKRVKAPYKAILDASKQTRILNIENLNPSIRVEVLYAITSSFCEMFKGDTINYSQLTPEIIEKSAIHALPQEDKLGDKQNLKILTIISFMDAYRTISILRAFRLVGRTSNHMYQIALGAGIGNKDLYTIHQEPDVVANTIDGQQLITFNLKQNKVKDIIIVDSDPCYADHFATLDREDYIHTYNMDTLAAIQEVAGSNLQKRNLVTLLRADHRMIPDISQFLHKLNTIITNDCDFILTIGSGDCIEDFKGRIELVDAMFKIFEMMKLKPILIKMHKEGTIEEQWSSLSVGHPSLGTYQILYCKLDRKILLEYLNSND